MKSPFKFLDAYTLKDRDAFFGREQEVEQLFEMTTENRLLLVYGQSGTGKTSLVQCGLAGRFYRTDWYPIQENLRNAYPALPEQAVRQVLDAFVTPEGTKRPVHFERQEGSGLIILEEHVRKLIPGLLSSPFAEIQQKLPTDEYTSQQPTLHLSR